MLFPVSPFGKILCFALVVVFCHLGNDVPQAFFSHITQDPTGILKKYLSLDKKGVRLEASTWEVVRPYVAWTDEPAWGQVVVISEFHVNENTFEWEIVSELEAKIPVTYDVLGIMNWDQVTFLKDHRQETHMFHIKAVYDRWQIVSPEIHPHVGRQRLMDFVRWAELQEADESKKIRFQRLHKQLKASKEDTLS